MFGKRGPFFDYAVYQIRTVSRHLAVRIALAFSVLSIGTSGAIYVVNHQAVTRSNTNACAINQFAQTYKDHINRVKGPGYKEAVKDLGALQVNLKPPLDQCK